MIISKAYIQLKFHINYKTQLMANLRKKVRQSMVGYDDKKLDISSSDDINLPIEKEFTWNLDLQMNNKT